ncbi:MAG: prepilin-type N-terminal cleavage/methylation domain-containing protein [Longimicrobiales bacterium]
MLRGRTRPRSGYTLIEVLVTVALLTVIAVVVVPILARQGAADRVARADTELKGITDALDVFAEDVGEWPPSLTQLVTPLVSGDQDICGTAYNGGERDRWTGPYLSRPVAGGGLPVGIGMVATSFTLSPGADIDFLHLTVTGVEEGDALELDARVDGDGDASAGTVRWTAAGNGQVTVTWRIPIHPC